MSIHKIDEDRDISPMVKLSSHMYGSFDAGDGRSLSPDGTDYSFQDVSNVQLPYGHGLQDCYDQQAGTSSILGAGTKRSVSRMSSLSRNLNQRVSDQSDNSEEEDDEELDVQATTLEGTYDPSEFDHLQVSEEIKDLFQDITRYTPQNIELDYKLWPFIPDFIPAVGDIDAFLKVPRPDGLNDLIGLRVLDEPCARQSEPAVLHLQLRAVAKQSSAKPVVVKMVENAEKNPKAIDRWIKDIGDLHRSKPPPTVHYTKPLPDVDGLLQEWPAEFEQKLREVGLPTPDLDCDLATYIDIVCGSLGVR
ncbi:intraflagellar transport protein 46 homolog isoform X3 [Bacillus rossius redtenbacheri]|uniref:intraflagellar transport protein 46 homolog isoform X3 n=1 Tax=Bacillus rossius redtenbacheri TaxID=93214 RepID=UPI002FDC9BEC